MGERIGTVGFSEVGIIGMVLSDRAVSSASTDKVIGYPPYFEFSGSRSDSVTK